MPEAEGADGSSDGRWRGGAGGGEAGRGEVREAEVGQTDGGFREGVIEVIADAAPDPTGATTDRASTRRLGSGGEGERDELVLPLPTSSSSWSADAAGAPGRQPGCELLRSRPRAERRSGKPRKRGCARDTGQ